MPTIDTPLPFIGTADLPTIERRDIATGEPLPMPVCPCCGEEFEESDGRVVDEYDAQVCPDCIHTCDSCGHQTTDESSILLARADPYARAATEHYCPDCRHSCDDCGGEFYIHADGGQNNRGEWICARCQEHYCNCERCERVIHNDRACYDETSEASYCQSCYDDILEEQEHDEAERDSELHPLEGGAARNPQAPPSYSRSHTDRLINGYSYKPRPRFFHDVGESPDMRPVYFGLEIETENIGNQLATDRALLQAQLPDAPEWYAKTDGSIYNGVELVSHPATFRYWAKHPFAVMDTLRKLHFRSYDTETCGMHIHISRNAFTLLGIWKLMEFFRRNPKFITRLSRRKAENLNQWARINGGPGGVDLRPSRKLISSAGPRVQLNRRIYVYEDIVGQRDVRLREWFHSDRYAAINLENAHTVELRIFRGTLDVGSIKRNIALAFALTQFVRHTDIKHLKKTDFMRWLKEHGKREIGKAHYEALYTWVKGCADHVSSDTGA